MRKLALILCLSAFPAINAPAQANLLVELSFAEKMATSDVVIVGTVTAAFPGRPEQFDATATVLTLATLKGTPEAQHIVLAREKIPENHTGCCQVGATYVMFLERTLDETRLRSINGRFGMIRIGPANNDPKIEVLGEDRGSNK